MDIQKPSIPKGTRDFSPIEMLRRNFIFNTIRQQFHLFGYAPIETPAMENLSTLMGKYGEEGDKLLFRILNSGDFLSGLSADELNQSNTSRLSSKICEKGLRYDLTVPFARYVVQHRNEIIFPFKRYQIQPVWRADRPQKGRYREFYQCDADVVGSNSLLNEAELIQLIDRVFENLNLQVKVKLNNRKILFGIAELIGFPDKIIDITVAIDKIEKIGIDKVNEELLSRGLTNDAVTKLQPILKLEGDNRAKLDKLTIVLQHSEVGLEGIAEIKKIFEYIDHIDLNLEIELDLTLARGLNYYTGAIIEVKSLEASMGSICGGGRYDNLTGIFGLEGVSGVGISFGADRIYDVLLQLNKFPLANAESTRLLFLNFGEKEASICIRLAKILRDSNISCEIFPEPTKIKKQMSYADDKKIEYVAIIGEDEMRENKITIKNMFTGEQLLIEQDRLLDYVLPILK